MKYRRKEVSNPFLENTRVENLFIYEYMADIPSDYVKVFLVISMCVDMNENMSEEDIAMLLRSDKENIKKAIEFLKARKLIRENNGEIIIENLKERVYGTFEKEPVCEKEIKQLDLIENKDLKGMYIQIEKTIGRPLSGVETTEVLDWINNFQATTEVIVAAYIQAAAKNKNNYRYVGKIVKEWTNKGLKTVLDVDEYLVQHDQRNYTYKRILQSLGFHRNPTEEEKRLVDIWMNELGATLEEILEACKRTSGIGNPNFNYVDKVVRGIKTEQKTGKSTDSKTITTAMVNQYYEKLRIEAEESAIQRREEVETNIPEISQINDRIAGLGMQIAKIMFSVDENRESKIKENKEKQKTLEQEKKNILTKNGIPTDYDLIKYKCPICEDTGTTDDGIRCKCYKERAAEISK